MTEVRIPELGESVTEGVIVRWLKDDGQPVQADESVLELETDKATLEIPATASGRLEIVERKGATVRVGTVVARIVEGAEQPAASGKSGSAAARATPSAKAPATPWDSGPRRPSPVNSDAEDRELLPGVDQDLVRPLEERLERLFATNDKSTRVTRLEVEDAGVRAYLEGAGVDSPQLFDQVLVAVGRKPRTEGLGLEAAGVELDDKGFVRVDRGRRTTEPRILAIGDVAGEPRPPSRAQPASDPAGAGRRVIPLTRPHAEARQTRGQSDDERHGARRTIRRVAGDRLRSTGAGRGGGRDAGRRR
jgi:pyruvate/2-oxoglutarate dehydrogenase complex dihydrolipoamide acyltransferase (E2) component